MFKRMIGVIGIAMLAALWAGVKFYKAGSDFRDAMNAFVKNLRKWEKISANEIKGSSAAFAKALRREVYDKLDPEKLSQVAEKLNG
ncbi:MAG: hypothetical protein QGF09_13050 [Rhodospirillales bacterium]|jgi:hypothetical protein|nr:hypothetical protein [Rhodospirillales bacterium]